MLCFFGRAPAFSYWFWIGTLHNHLQSHGVDYLQFSFRWMNNLLTRELPLHSTIRLWDTYLAESDGFAVFQLYVCAAFLLHWRKQLLKETEFQVTNYRFSITSKRTTHSTKFNEFHLHFTFRSGTNVAAPKFAHTKLEWLIHWDISGRSIPLEIYLCRCSKAFRG